MSALVGVIGKNLQHVCASLWKNVLKIMKRFKYLLYSLHLICKYMALNVMKLCHTHAFLTRSKITPEIG